MELASRLEDNWTQRNLRKLESVCCWKWELTNCWDDQLDESTWTCWIGMKWRSRNCEVMKSGHKKSNKRHFLTTKSKKTFSRLSGFWGQKWRPEAHMYLPDKFQSRYGYNQIDIGTIKYLVQQLETLTNAKSIHFTNLANVQQFPPWLIVSSRNSDAWYDASASFVVSTAVAKVYKVSLTVIRWHRGTKYTVVHSGINCDKKAQWYTHSGNNVSSRGKRIAQW